MKRRLKLEVRDKDVLLVTQDGTRVGRLLALDVELDEPEEPKVEQQTLDVGPNPVDEVWAEYVRVMEPRKKELDPDGRRVIRDALKVASVDECCDAIRGCRSSRFHMGENDHRRKYNALSQILKGKQGKRTTREQIDFFLDIARKSGVESRVTSGDAGRVAWSKRAVLDGKQYGDDPYVAERAAEARAWLESNGYRVVDTELEDGQPWARFEAT